MKVARIVALVVAVVCIGLGLFVGLRPVTTQVMVLCTNPVIGGGCPMRDVACGNAFSPREYGDSDPPAQAYCDRRLHDPKVKSVTLLGAGTALLLGGVVITVMSRTRRRVETAEEVLVSR